MARANLTDLLIGYETDAERTKRFKAFAITGNVTRTRLKFVRRILSLARGMLNTFSYSSTRSYGLFMIGFGFLSFLLHAIQNYTAAAQIPLYVILSSVAISLLGIPLVCFDREFAIAMQGFSVTDRLFFDFFCLKRMHRIDVKASRNSDDRVFLIKPYVALILGLLLASFTMLIPMWWILVGIGVFIFLFLTFISPEFSFFSIILAMPYLPTLYYSDLILGMAVLAVFLSFAVKVALGKRVYYFEQYDLLLGLFLVFVLISGIFVKGFASFGASLILVLFSMGYVLASSLISNRRLADCVINALIVSALPVSAIAVFEGARSLVKNGIRGFEPVHATFESSSSLAIFLLVVLVFTLYYIKSSHIPAAKFGYGAMFVLILAALLSTAEIWAFVAGIFGIVAYLFTRIKRSGPVLVGILSFIPYAVLFIPMEVLDFIEKLPFVPTIGLAKLTERWGASFRMLADNILVGVGIGGESFSSEIVYYSSEIYSNSSNLLLEIGCEAGIFALVFFVAIVLVRVIHQSAYRRYVAVSSVRRLSAFASVATCVLFVFGAINYLFSDLSLNLLYWCVLGIGSATLRVAGREHDDLIGYYSDGSSRDSSSIDVDLT